MKIKKGDNVIVISGKDKGKQGKILETFPLKDRVVVEGVNVRKKYVKDRKNDESKLVDLPYPVHVSNVMIYDEKAKKGSKIGFEFVDGKKVRVLKASKTQLK